jgi:hypothetical protein
MTPRVRRAAALALAALTLGAATGCSRHPSRRGPTEETMDPASRLQTLRDRLRCDGSRELVARQTCFAQIVRLFNAWPPSPERASALDEAQQALRLWSPIFRQAHASAGSNLVHDDAGRVFDTLSLVRDLVVLRLDDDSRAPPLSALLRSTHGRDLVMLTVRRVTLDLDDLAASPGCAGLLALSLDDAARDDADWGALRAWSGLTTVQAFTLVGAGQGAWLEPGLWDTLDRATALTGLHARTTDFARFMERLAQHAPVARRIDQLSLTRSFIGDADLPRLVGATSLERLLMLDLRGNRISVRAARRTS